MALLGFILECAAVAAFLGGIASVLALAAWLLGRPLVSRLDPSMRAELVFVLALVPALASVGGTSAAALPSVLAALGLAPDHCESHLHHLHLCMMHSAGIRPALATMGAFAIAGFVIRGAWMVHGHLETHRALQGLVALAAPFVGPQPVFIVPGAPRLCHAMGVFRRRILVSSDLVESLPRDQLRSAVEHEAAHLLRRDPLAHLVLSIARLFQLPGLSLFSRAYRSAAEEACDDHAAVQVGDGALVAEALVSVAAIQRGVSLGCIAPAFGQEHLEARVRRLLDGTPRPRRSFALTFGSLAGVLVALVAVTESHFFHHAVETILFQIF